MEIKQLLLLAVEQNASDLHLSAGLRPRIRVDGELRILDLPILSDDELTRILHSCMSEQMQKQLATQFEVDFAYQLKDIARFRVNVFQQDRGIAGVFRHIPEHIQSLDELEMPEILKSIALLPRGLVLVTGPTGCGKSTTLASIIDYINSHRSAHIVTVEDPIEFVHTSKLALVNQREIGRDSHSFSVALRSALREDPNVILVGEMRDLETMRLALTAAETGHLVFATLHTMSAVKTIARIIDVFPGEERALVRAMLSESLQAVLSQLLLKKTTGGRVAASELMICTPAIKNLIREDKLAQAYSTLQTSSEHGMYTLDQNLKYLVDSKVISLETARAVAQDRNLFSS